MLAIGESDRHTQPMAHVRKPMFYFKDFRPKIEQLRLFGKIRKATDLEELVAEANAWIA
jgi:hypothetical protein